MIDAGMGLSAKAITHIKKIMERRGGGAGFRLAVKQTGCSGYMYVPDIVDTPKADDLTVFEQDGLTVFLDPEALSIVKGTYIDFVAKDFGMEQLVYDNPNADSLCGCGESFNLKESEEETNA
ncbi:MAG: FeS assembly scaffold SufA [Coxiella sp. (in: Bacteria)]|nr:MAG: FeS assembly scaffold SufA [Coxiella sp. (in: g-proteobacteria)]